MKPTDFSKNLAYFLTKYLAGERGLSFNTISSYKTTFILFILFFEKQEGKKIEKLELKDIDKDCVVQFLSWIQLERCSSDATRNVRLAALHAFFRFLQYNTPEKLNEWQRILSIRAKKAEKGTINYLTIEGIILLLQQPDVSTKKGIRDLALLSLMYDSAARVSEIINLTPSMIRIEKPYTVKLLGKGNKSRIVPLMEQEVSHLKNYMIMNKLLENESALHPLFFNNQNGILSRAGVNYILQYYAKAAREIKPELIPQKISCHSLRHSKAVHLSAAGVNLVYIRDILGHSSVVTTELYAKVETKQKREAIEKAYVDVIGEDVPIWTENTTLLNWLINL